MLRFPGSRFSTWTETSANIPCFVQSPRVTICDDLSTNNWNRENVGERANTCGRKSIFYPCVHGKTKTKTSLKAAPLSTSVACAVTTPAPHSNELLRIAIMVSGGGRSLQNICEQISSGRMKRCQVSLVIASKPSAGAIPRAEHFGVPTRVVRAKDFDGNIEYFSEAISCLLDEFQINLVVMAGWMHFYLIPERYNGKVINIHPSLIPSFCGKGYYGSRVHEAVIKFGAKITGCTVHLADNEYDHGPIIVQKAVPVFDTDTVEELAGRVFEKEKEALPEAIQLFVDGRLSVDNGIIRIAGLNTKESH